MSIKKSFVEIVELLEANEQKKVKDILPEIIELVTSKQKATTVFRDIEGNITHIFCYYHKKWESVEFYGQKASSHTGFNTMCKEGVNRWTKQHSQFRKLKGELLEKIVSDELAVEDLAQQLKQLEDERNVIIPRADSHGYEEIDEIE